MVCVSMVCLVRQNANVKHKKNINFVKLNIYFILYFSFKQQTQQISVEY